MRSSAPRCPQSPGAEGLLPEVATARSTPFQSGDSEGLCVVAGGGGVGVGSQRGRRTPGSSLYLPFVGEHWASPTIGSHYNSTLPHHRPRTTEPAKLSNVEPKPSLSISKLAQAFCSSDAMLTGKLGNASVYILSWLLVTTRNT